MSKFNIWVNKSDLDLPWEMIETLPNGETVRRI